jgi:hypothetical protein
VDQQFESDVMHDLMADSPTASADDAFQEDMFDDSFETEGFEDDAMMDGMEQYDEAGEDYGDEAYFDEAGFEDSFDDGFEDSFAEDYGDGFTDEFAEDDMDVMDVMEEAVADTLDADDTDVFLRRLISAVRRVAGVVGRGAGVAGRVAGQTQRIAGQVGRVAQGVQGLASAIEGGRPSRQRRGRRVRNVRRIGRVIPRLQRHIAQGFDEMDVFDDLVDWFEQEQVDEALPIVSGVTLRTVLCSVFRQICTRPNRAINRQIVRATTQAAQNLARQQGASAVRALRPIVASVGRVAARRGTTPRALPNAIRQTAARVAAQPALTRRLAQTTNIRTNTRTGVVPRTRLNISGAGTGRIPRRLVLDGPVEIIIRR